MFTTSLALLAGAMGSPGAEAPQPIASPVVVQQRSTRTTGRARSAPRVRDGDADLTRSGRLRLDAETAASATRVTFTYRGSRATARRTEADAEDRTTDWGRTVAARGARPGSVVRFRVTACEGSSCSSRTFSERLEREDD